MHNIQTTLNLDQTVTARSKGRHRYLLQKNLADSLQMGNLEARSSCTEKCPTALFAPQASSQVPHTKVR